jgi:hypothetical protein
MSHVILKLNSLHDIVMEGSQRLLISPGLARKKISQLWVMHQQETYHVVASIVVLEQSFNYNLTALLKAFDSDNTLTHNQWQALLQCPHAKHGYTALKIGSIEPLLVPVACSSLIIPNFYRATLAHPNFYYLRSDQLELIKEKNHG